MFDSHAALNFTCADKRFSKERPLDIGLRSPPAILVVQDLNDSMQSHLRLHFNNEEASDEQVCPECPISCCFCYAH